LRRILVVVAVEREEVMMVVVTVAGSQVERDVEVDRPSVVRERLESFAGEVLAGAMNRPVQVRNGGLYVRGLIGDGARKSLEPLVLRLGGDAEYQSMQQFLADSPWDSGRVVQAVAERVAPEIGVEAWVVDDTGFPKDGKDSPGVKRQYSGTFGKVANCQIGVSLHAVGTRGTVPLGWTLYLPEEWCADSGRRRKAKIPDAVAFKTKYELAVELVEHAWGWAVPRAPVLGDHDYGRRGGLRARLDQAGCEYVLAVGPTRKVFEHGTTFQTRTKRGYVRKHPRPGRAPEPLGKLIARLGQGSAQTVSFRDGPDGEPVTSRFIFTRVHVARAESDEQRETRDPETGAELPPREEWLIAEWPAGAEKASGYWLSNLPADTRPSGSPGSRACAGRSNSTTSSSKANSAWTTTKDAHGSGGITTPGW
jgi:hypothetical protein